MKELIRVRVQYASRQRCCKTHKRPLPLPFTFSHSFSLRYDSPLSALPHEVPDVADNAQNNKYYSFLSLGAVVSLSYESV